MVHYLNQKLHFNLETKKELCQRLTLNEETSAEQAGKNYMGTISKALNLLNYFSETDPELGLLDIKKLSNQDKATVHRHLGELEANGFLEQNAATRKYRLGAAILRLAAVREKTFPSRKIISRHVHKLSQELGELVHASLMQKREMSPLEFSDAGVGGTRVYFNLADTLPLHATASGIAALAYGAPDMLERTLNEKLEKFTVATIINPQKLRELISKTREQGFSFSDELFENEISSIAVPFFERQPFLFGTLAVAVPSSRMTEKNKTRFVRALQVTSRDITRDLGGELPAYLNSIWQHAA